MTGVGGVSGVVLAGGRSSRFGASKLDADLGGATVLDHTIERLRPLCDEVIVVGRVGFQEDLRFLSDPIAFEGPLAGLALGVEAGTAELVVVVGGDMPLLQPDVLRLLVDRVRGDDAADAAVLEDADSIRPLPVALRRAPAGEAARLALGAGGRSLRACLDRLRVESVPESVWRLLDPDGDTLLDVDVPADLERARARIGSR